MNTWIWSLNWGEVTPKILVGSCPMTPMDLERISRSAGVSAVLSLQHDGCLAYWGIDYRQMVSRAERLGLVMARSPMRDFDIVDQRRNLPRAVATLFGLQNRGHLTYVHCTAGLGRAPLTVLSYLVWIEGLSPEDAIQLIRRGRPGAVPAWEAHHGSREDLVERHRVEIERRAYERFNTRRPWQDEAKSDWLHAEAEVIYSVLTTMDLGANKIRV